MSDDEVLTLEKNLENVKYNRTKESNSKQIKSIENDKTCR